MYVSSSNSFGVLFNGLLAELPANLEKQTDKPYVGNHTHMHGLFINVAIKW